MACSGLTSRKGRDFQPTEWSLYFDRRYDVPGLEAGETFRVYEKGSGDPVVFLLHGGGHSALSFALFASEVVAKVCCRVVAYDCRGHGATIVNNEDGLYM